MEVNAVYNFTTVNVLSNDIFGNSCPIGSDEQFFDFVNAVQNYPLSFSQPCAFPVSHPFIERPRLILMNLNLFQAIGRYEVVDADFDVKLVDTLKPILPAGDYNAYVRVYRNSNNLTLAFQTLYGSFPILDLGLGTLPIVGNAFG